MWPKPRYAVAPGLAHVMAADGMADGEERWARQAAAMAIPLRISVRIFIVSDPTTPPGTPSTHFLADSRKKSSAGIEEAHRAHAPFHMVLEGQGGQVLQLGDGR